MADFLAVTNLQDEFFLPLSLEARDELWEMQELTASTHPMQGERDVWSCVWGAKYSSRQFYAYYFRNVTVDDAFRWIWKSKCTMKIKVFGWLVAADGDNTKNMLRMRHWNVADGINCGLCGNGEEETVEHLFLDCPFSTEC